MKRPPPPASPDADPTALDGARRTTDAEVRAHEALQAYTLTHGDARFIHQHVVDAWAAQHAEVDGKPIGLTFALVGLFLLVEKQFSGREVQRAHMALGRCKQAWPVFAVPARRGDVTVLDVMAAPPGPDRDRAIHAWCASVWAAFSGNRSAVVDLLARNAVLPGK